MTNTDHLRLLSGFHQITHVSPEHSAHRIVIPQSVSCYYLRLEHASLTPSVSSPSPRSLTLVESDTMFGAISSQLLLQTDLRQEHGKLTLSPVKITPSFSWCLCMNTKKKFSELWCLTRTLLISLICLLCFSLQFTAQSLHCKELFS